ncbi:MAG: hypothetical protein ABSB15_16605 [Bryobacteraceae bacterium]
MRLRLFLGAIFLAGPLLNAQVAVREYNLHIPRDRAVFFTMAVTPDADVLSWVAKADGKWLLTRVRNWLDFTPKEQTIDVPSWTRADLAAAFGPPHPDLFVTPDGHFAICVASAKWNRNQQVSWDTLISVVDLQRFEVVATAHPPVNPGETRSFYLDGAQHLVLETNQRLLLLDVPSLSVIPSDDKDKVMIVGGSRETGNGKRVSLNGRTYQLVMEGGAKLKVYEVRE